MTIKTSARIEIERTAKYLLTCDHSDEKEVRDCFSTKQLECIDVEIDRLLDEQQAVYDGDWGWSGV